MKKVNVVIAGTTGAGKTTLVKLVADFLTSEGFQVEVAFKDKMDIQNEILTSEEMTERKNEVKKKSKIVLTSAQVSRQLI
jgi:Flp pilus assembly CpaF family ATPase